jgi:hypothetical protein
LFAANLYLRQFPQNGCGAHAKCGLK